MLIAGGFVTLREATDWACELVATQTRPSEQLLELAGAVRPDALDVLRMREGRYGTLEGARADLLSFLDREGGLADAAGEPRG